MPLIVHPSYHRQPSGGKNNSFFSTCLSETAIRFAVGIGAALRARERDAAAVGKVGRDELRLGSRFNALDAHLDILLIVVCAFLFARLGLDPLPGERLDSAPVTFSIERFPGVKIFSPQRWLGVRPGTIRRLRGARGPFLRPFLQQLEDRVMLSTLLVNNLTDAPMAHETSLREAIVQANTDAAAGISDTIAFDASLGSSTIKLTQGPLELSGAGTGTITIDGSSPSTPIALSAVGSSVFLIDGGVSAVLTNLKMVGGNSGSNPGGDILNAGTLTVSNAIVSGGKASSGGGIENEGELTLSNVTLTGNSAANSGGAVDSTGTLTVNDCTFTSNQAGGGGAISTDGMLTVNNSTFSDDNANNTGGAIAIVSASAIITGSFFTSNFAASGGAGKQRWHRHPHWRQPVQE